MSCDISVLVPICNVEKYLSQCLDSILNQTFRNLEVICINDGSTDGSLDIIKKYAKIDDRIVVIDKANSGYGDSMNRGLSVAKGKYIGIVESDDFIESDMYERLFNEAEKYDLDIVKGKYNCYWSDDRHEKHSWRKQIQKDIAAIENKVFCPREYPVVCLTTPSIWSALYKRNFLMKNNIQFLPTLGASYQDTSFAFKVWGMASKAMLLDYYGVNYRQDNPNASMNTVSRAKIYALDAEYEEIIRFFHKNGIYDVFKAAIYTYMINTIAWNIRRMESDMILDYIHVQKNKFPMLFNRKNNLFALLSKNSNSEKGTYISIYYNQIWMIHLYRWLRLKLGHNSGR